jgi:hypothetical protein
MGETRVRRWALSEQWAGEIERILKLEDRGALLALAGGRATRLLQYLTRRLSSAREEEKWRAVWALGVVVGDQQLISPERATDLLRRFLWSLNDESGAVPNGVPEAIGEILAFRPELQGRFLPLLCSFVTDEDLTQTGAIERGVLWALGRIGPSVARCSPEAVEAIKLAAKSHPDPDTRKVAAQSLAKLQV